MLSFCLQVRCGLTDASVWFRGTRSELEHVGPLLPETPAVQDLPVTLFKLIKLQRVRWIQQPVK